MSITNKVSFALSDQELSEINAALDTLYRILTPKTIALTPELRKQLAKMGDKTIAFTEKGMELGNQNSEFVPSFVDMKEANVDFQAFKLLRMINRRIDALSQLLEDTQMQSGNEVYSVVLRIYDHIKAIAKSIGSMEAQKAKDELSARFPGSSSKMKALKQPSGT